MRIHITHTRGVVETIRNRLPFHIEDSFSHPDTGSFHVHWSPFPEALDLPHMSTGSRTKPLGFHDALCSV